MLIKFSINSRISTNNTDINYGASSGDAVSLRVEIEFEFCTRSTCVKELKVLQSKNTNIVNIIFIIASHIPSMFVTTYEQSTTKDY